MDELWRRYERAEQLCEWNVRALVRNVSVTPRWLGDGDRFSYEHQTPDGIEQRLVDPLRSVIEPVEHPLEAAVELPAGHLRSPDGRWDLVALGHDLLLQPSDGRSGAERQLTSDGAADLAYGAGAQSSTSFITAQRSGVAPAPVALWSPDSKKVLTHRLDQRQVPLLHLLESRPDEGFRPRLWSYRMPLVGDELATATLVVLNLEDGTCVEIEGDPLLVEWASPIEIGWVWWDEDSDKLWFLREERGARSLSLCVADARTGAVRTLISEEAEDLLARGRCSTSWTATSAESAPP